MANPEYNQYRYLKNQERLTRTPEFSETDSKEAKNKAWMRKAAAQHKLKMFSDVGVDKELRAAKVEEMIEATEAGIDSAAKRRERANTDKGKAYWKNVERGLKIKKTRLSRSLESTKTINVIMQFVVDTAAIIETPPQVAEKSNFQRILDGEVGMTSKNDLKVPLETEIVPDNFVKNGLEVFRTISVPDNDVIKPKKIFFGKALRWIATAVGVYALVKSGIVQWFADKGQVFVEAWSNRNGRPTEVAGIVEDVATPTETKTPIPTGTKTYTPESKSTATTEPTPTATPTPNEFMVTVGDEHIDLTKNFSIKWSRNVLNVAGLEKHMEMITEPFVVRNKEDNDKLPNVRGADDNNGKEHWKEHPELAVVMNAGKNWKVIEIESGALKKTKPNEMDEEWQIRYLEAYPEKKDEMDKPQAFNLGGQVLVELAYNLPSQEVDVEIQGVKNGVRVQEYVLPKERLTITIEGIEYQITDLRKVSLEDWQWTCGSTDEGWHCDLTNVGLQVSDRNGITISTCADYEDGTFVNRMVASLEPVNTNDGMKLITDGRNKLIEEVNNYQYYQGGLAMGDFIKQGEWFRGLPINEQEKTEPILNNLVNVATNLFPNGERGIQCMGWAGLSVGDKNDFLYIGGDGVDKDPGQIVPEIVKGASGLPVFSRYELGGREWWTGPIDYRKLKKGDLILLWDTGAVRQSDGKDSGHAVVLEESKLDENGEWIVVTSEGNPLSDPGAIVVNTISSQEEFDQTFGGRSAVLVNNFTAGEDR